MIGERPCALIPFQPVCRGGEVAIAGTFRFNATISCDKLNHEQFQIF
jgi:hypothetical protein